MRLYERKKMGRRRESGQTLLMFVLFLVVLILFVGLGIDLGFAYVTKAQLSKAVDAAALAGILNLPQGTSTASNVAQNTFYANYHTSGRDVGTVTPSVTFSNDASNGNNLINVSASTSINTFFIRVLPQWHTMQVVANAQGTRSKLIISLVLDRSGSMNPDPHYGTTHGGIYLPGAVDAFISFFDDTQDRMAMVSFSSTANVETNFNSLGQPFKNAISNKVNSLSYTGGTFSVGGLALGFALNTNVTVLTGQTVNRAVVFFTDGLANIVQQALSCGKTLNFGGHDADNYVSFWDPTTPENSSLQGNPPCGGPDPATPSGCTCNSTTFFSQENNSNESFTRAHVTAEAQYQCIQVANQMRDQGIYVFSAGLGGSGVDTSFLAEVANAPGSQNFRSDRPVGLALIANDGTQLASVFKEIARQILLRLTR